MKKSLKRGGVALGLLLSLALGYALGTGVRVADQAVIAAEVKEIDTIEKFRQERQQLRQMQLSQLNEIIYNENTEAEIVASAQRKQMEIMEWSEQELSLEGILAMRSFEGAVVTVHTDSVNVMVRAETLSQQEAAVILELVTRETGISGGNVKIIPIK